MILAKAPAALNARPGIPLLRRFAADFLRKYTYRCWVAAGLLVSTAALQVILPLLFAFVIDRVVGWHDANRLLDFGLLLTGAALLYHLCLYLGDAMVLWLSESLILDVERQTFTRLFKAALSALAGKDSGYWQARAMDDARAIEGAVIRGMLGLVLDLLTYIIVIAVIVLIRPLLAGTVIISSAIFASLIYWSDSRAEGLASAVTESTAQAAGFVLEGLGGIRVVKAYRGEDQLVENASRYLQIVKERKLALGMHAIKSRVAPSLLSALTSVAVLWYGSYEIFANKMTVGELFAVMLMLSFLYNPVVHMIESNLQMQKSLAAIGRLYELLDLRAEEPLSLASPVGQPEQPAIAGDLDVQRLAFSYENGPPVLTDVSFSVRAGECVALVGRSGTGKSTLVSLLLGFFRHYEGSISLGGSNIQDLPLDTLRRSICLVDQTAVLFSGTVFDNIALGKPHATQEEVVIAAQSANAHEFIGALPNGYNSPVGEHGQSLSVGQRQRIALARAFLLDPPFLVLDEATSALDSESETRIQQSLERLAKNRTTVIIAHRLSSLMMSSRVIVLDGGKIVENESPEKLLASQGVFKQLFADQILLNRNRTETVSLNDKILTAVS